MKHRDLLPGGKADNLSPKDFDQRQLRAGEKVESEHVQSRTLAREIAMDHLVEDPRYYTKLKKIHKEASAISFSAFVDEVEKIATSASLGVAGRAVGEAIQAQLVKAVRGLRNVNPAWLKEGIKLARQHTPRAVALLEGIASGAGVSFEQAFSVWYEELRDAKPRREIRDTGCTDIAVRVGSDVLIAHTNDEDPGDGSRLLPIDVSGLPSLFVAFTGGRPSIAVNSAGIVFSGNQVDATDVRPGIPRVLLYIEALWSRSIDEAAKILLHPQRASSYHNLLADEHGSVVGYEASAKKAVVLTPRNGILVHSNHYVGIPEVEGRKGKWFDKSVDRLHRAYGEIQSHRDHVTPKTLIEIMSTHGDGALCRHGETQTTFSVVFKPTAREFWYADGSPCTGKFRKYRY